MRSFLFVASGILIGVGAFLGTNATSPIKLATSPDMAPMASSASDPNLGKNIRAYLMANPEVLVDAMAELERKQDAQRDNVAQKAIKDKQAELLNDKGTPSTGNASGDVTIVEFSDYQCPYCKRAYSAVKSVVATDGKIKLVYKDLPILGEASKVAAVAALASIKQGKHEAFHDALMTNTAKLDNDLIFAIAAKVGIDVAKLKQDMDDPEIKKIIDRNMALAEDLGVRGTPAFVIGNQFVPGAVDADALKKLVADARNGA